jgi:hypothetical protein
VAQEVRELAQRSASVTLNDEAQTLKALVSRFRTSHGTAPDAGNALARDDWEEFRVD